MSAIVAHDRKLQIMHVFDGNGDGDVDYEEFREVVGKLLMPGMTSSSGRIAGLLYWHHLVGDMDMLDRDSALFALNSNPYIHSHQV